MHKEVEKMLSTREAYGQALAEMGEKYDFYVLDADLSKATQTVLFAKKFPERFMNMGIAESNMMDFAAGINWCGRRKPSMYRGYSFNACDSEYDGAVPL